MFKLTDQACDVDEICFIPPLFVMKLLLSCYV